MTRKIVDSEKFVKKVETKSASQGFIELVPKENLERRSLVFPGGSWRRPCS